ncbi:acetyl-CoA carboxylase, biotin carboxyl carrier protein [Lentilactobacillus fungorum]|uniref:Biotin carboxyl carrier protein of acetyl-CoA carboxylase n=1 Tax=Lentilactobacillus fungorum TaxID=2201250 RepID=A0ABQ3W1K7_9LACO|nr:acetyl-CoA carboxylase biotin carboxyl carrier protein [Lentilactobacillus fungorum]GHP14715.1 acetyl-CoA carboxylase, biotin carboxyl carrier protein [Lentilactobacillus fungorum]
MDEKEIERLLDKFDQSSLKDFELTQDNFKLSLSKREQADKVVAAQPAPSLEQPQAHETKQASLKDSGEAQAPVDNNVVEIKAPLVGVVYFAPSPDKPVFKKQGDHVEKGEVVCVIEAMKMINEVKSDVTGTIANVLVEDGSMVEYDQPIFQVTKG